jgi:hypothetical protein
MDKRNEGNEAGQLELVPEPHSGVIDLTDELLDSMQGGDLPKTCKYASCNG